MAVLPGLVQWGIITFMVALAVNQEVALRAYRRTHDVGCIWIALIATCAGLIGSLLILIGGLL